ncbi:hypothetical protein [Mangrovibacterium diazotrophicum]|uniref:Uncharacterized protein n=1 Tax=Mangrovibacterium diazotrophicum TaxID=1261403 RepID=A0A419VWL1_9BACT|nr:hypothetical protein [Mangrovibacterium diazotrophicum]RKD86540.1 hypothetical protein BC643_4238 [Mangrovibacterium diazotrophicum]
MKRIFLLAAFIASVMTISAQETYKYVIIPTTAPEIGKGIDPYGVCSSLQKALSAKSIVCMFEGPDRPTNYCDGLNAEIVKENSLLKNKVSITLKDCMNRVVWTGVGSGMSKEYRPGYAEAIEDALKDLNEMPAVKFDQPQSTTSPAPVAKAEVVAAPVVAENAVTEDYTPQNIYYDDTYLVDYVSSPNGDRKLIVLNSNSLGYDKMQEIAILTPSDLTGIYTVKFVQPNGDEWSGVANESGSELKISIKSGDEKKVITLHKQ